MSHGLNGPSFRQHVERHIGILRFLAKLFQPPRDRGVLEAELRAIETIPTAGFDERRLEENHRILGSRNVELEFAVDFHVRRKQRKISGKRMVDAPPVKRASQPPRSSAPVPKQHRLRLTKMPAHTAG